MHLNNPLLSFPTFGEAPRNNGGLSIMFGCVSMRVMVGWFRGNYDACFEVYEVGDKEFWRMPEEFRMKTPSMIPDRDTTYYVREKGRPVCRVEPSYTIIVNDER
jgi:hypothetical protein